MSVELNLLNLQAQTELPRKVSAKSRSSIVDRSQREEEDFSRLLRDLRKKTNARGNSPNEQGEDLLAGILTAFPSLPKEVVMHAEEGETATEEGLVAVDLNGQPPLATEEGAFLPPDVTASLSGEGSGEASAAVMASAGNATETLVFPSETATEATTEFTVLPVEESADGAQKANFPDLITEEPIANSVFATGETGGLLPEESAAHQELREEITRLFTELAAAGPEVPAVEGQSEPTSAFGWETGTEHDGINQELLLSGKEVTRELSQPEPTPHFRPLENAAVLEIDPAQPETKEETPDLAQEREAADLLMASENSILSTGKKRVNEQDAAFHQIVEVASSTPGETTAATGRLESPEETVPTTLPKEEVVGQIINGAKLMVKDQATKIQLQLEPAELGKLELSLVVERDLVTARFVAETQGVQSLIEANLSQLRSALQEAGLTVDLLQVDVHTGNDSQLQEHSFTADHRSTPGAPGQNGADELLAIEEQFLTEESWHGLVNMRV